MKIFKSKFGKWETFAPGKDKDGKESKAYVDIQWPKGYEPSGDEIFGKLILKTDDMEKECFFSSYPKANGEVKIKLVVLGEKKVVQEQTSLTGNDTDVTGHLVQDNKVVIEAEELPFY